MELEFGLGFEARKRAPEEGSLAIRIGYTEVADTRLKAFGSVMYCQGQYKQQSIQLRWGMAKLRIKLANVKMVR